MDVTYQMFREFIKYYKLNKLAEVPDVLFKREVAGLLTHFQDWHRLMYNGKPLKGVTVKILQKWLVRSGHKLVSNKK